MHFKNHQKSRIELLKDISRGGIGAELGVFTGDFSWNILKYCAPKRLYLVDLFDGPIMSGDENGDNIRVANMSSMRWRLETDFATHPVTIVKADSVSWLQEQEPGSLDFAYIDTTHTLEQTMAELVAAQSAVKIGGLICGHDYSPQFPGVMTAVERFCTSFGLGAEIYLGDRLPSYRIVNSRRDANGFWKEPGYAFEN